MARSCPDAFAERHTPCGYPSKYGQPDTFVNEEWFGLFSLVGQCPKSQIDQIKPRAAWFGLKVRVRVRVRVRVSLTLT